MNLENKGGKGGKYYIVFLNVVNTATSLSQQTKTSWPFHLKLKSGGPSKMSGIIAPTSVIAHDNKVIVRSHHTHSVAST